MMIKLLFLVGLLFSACDFEASVSIGQQDSPTSEIITYPAGSFSTYGFGIGGCWQHSPEQDGIAISICDIDENSSSCPFSVTLSNGQVVNYSWECGSKVKVISAVDPISHQKTLYIIIP